MEVEGNHVTGVPSIATCSSQGGSQPCIGTQIASWRCSGRVEYLQVWGGAMPCGPYSVFPSKDMSADFERYWVVRFFFNLSGADAMNFKGLL